MDVEPAARKHGVDEQDMLHTVRHHWRAFETDDPAVTMFIGPSRTGAVGGWGGRGRRWGGDHPRHACTTKVPEGLVDGMSTTRAARAKALEKWADEVDAEELVVADTAALRAIAELAQRRGELDAALVEAVRSARAAERSWSEIGAMLGVSKQAAQRKYAKVAVR